MCKTEVTIFHSQISEVTPHHICHNLLVKNKSLGPSHTEEEGIKQECEYWELGSLGANLETAYHPHSQELAKLK